MTAVAETPSERDGLIASCRTLPELMRARAEVEGARIAWTFLRRDRESTLSFGELFRRSRWLAAELATVCRAGQRVLLLLPFGDEFPVALFAALDAGLVAVPAPVPQADRLRRTLPRLRAIAGDCEPTAVVTTAGLTDVVGEWLGAGFPVLAVPNRDHDEEVAPMPAAVEPEHLAVLQYTSGSTAAPKGVMLTHADLFAGAVCLRHEWLLDDASRALIWVPDFHDDGLMQGNVMPVFTGHHCWRLPAEDVVGRPASWLEAIGRNRITHSGGPNFGYDLCLRKVSAQQAESLDLRSWQLAYNAAEPVRRRTLEEFVAKFAPAGFRASAFAPAYGLAEATLLVASATPGEGPTWLQVDRARLELEGRVSTVSSGGVSIVSCGPPAGTTRLAVVDPADLRPLGEDRLGEILVSSPSLAAGYWNRPLDSAKAFLDPAPCGPGSWLRTGDVGFLHSGSLYISGRIKDLIILRGRNIAPNDIELSVESAGDGLRPGCGAAVAVETGSEERLVIIQEVTVAEESDADRLCRLIVERVVDDHGVSPSDVVVVRSGTIPKTSSGKVQRHLCRAAWLDGSLEVVARWPPAGGVRNPSLAQPAPESVESVDRQVEDRVDWLRAWSRARLDLVMSEERQSLSPAVVLDLGGEGFFGLLVPVELEGCGLGFRGFARVIQQAGAIDLGLAVFLLGQNALGSYPLVRFGSDGLRRRVVPGLASGRRISAFALTEPGAGSELGHLAAAARWADESGHWKIEGVKVWSTSASWAHWIHVFAIAEPGAGQSGLTGFTVPGWCAGLSVGPETPTLGLRSTTQSTVRLSGVEVDRDAVLGGVGEGLAVIQQCLAAGRCGLAAASLGAMMRSLELLERYASGRPHGNGHLLDQPLIRRRLGEIVVSIEALRPLVEYTAQLLDRDAPARLDVALVAKVIASELLWWCADVAVQALGGRGYSESNPFSRMLRDARAFRILEGPTEVLVTHLGRRWMADDESLRRVLSDDLGATDLRSRSEAAAGGGGGAEDLHAAEESRNCVWEAAGWAVCWAVTAGAFRRDRSMKAREPELTSAAEGWLEERVEMSVARLGRVAAGPSWQVTAPLLQRAVADYRTEVGDGRTASIGVDRQLDALLADSDAQQWTAAARVPPHSSAVSAPEPIVAVDGTTSLQGWLEGWLRSHLELPVGPIDHTATWSALGLDSVTGPLLVMALEEHLHLRLDPALPWQQPTPGHLLDFLTGAGTVT